MIARRLAENSACNVLLIEAGGTDDTEAVLDPSLWPTNLGSERDWGFVAEPNRDLGGRALPMSMGKGLGGGSSVNVMVWARGHRSDWDHFAEVSGDDGWGYEAVLDIYRRIESWQGAPNERYRGTNGPVWVQPPHDPSPIAGAMLQAAQQLGIPRFDSPNGAMMESEAARPTPTCLCATGGATRSIAHTFYRGPTNRISQC